MSITPGSLGFLKNGLHEFNIYSFKQTGNRENQEVIGYIKDSWVTHNPILVISLFVLSSPETETSQW